MRISSAMDSKLSGKEYVQQSSSYYNEHNHLVLGKRATYARGKISPHEETGMLQPAGTSAVAKMTIAATETKDIVSTNQ